MKNIRLFKAKKYSAPEYLRINEGVYKIGDEYYTSLSFEQEPEIGEGSSSADISQYPLEDLLDETGTYISDFYQELNTEESVECVLEFASSREEAIIAVLDCVGKHVYNKELGGSVELIIE